MLGYTSTFTWIFYDSTLTFTSYWYRGSRSARDEILELSQVFLDMCTVLTHTHDPLDSQKISGICQKPLKAFYGHLIFPDIPFKVFFIYLFSWLLSC